MLSYILRRLFILPVTLFGLTILIFALLQMLDPVVRASMYLPPGAVPRTPTAMYDIIVRYGLDQPIYIQYFNYVGQLVHGNLGWSKTAQVPVLEAIANFFPATLELVIWSFIPIMVIGIWLGVKAAVHHDRFIDHAARIFSIVGYAFPTFVFGLLMLMIFYAALQWLPPGRLSDWATAVVYSDQFNRITNMHSFDAILNGRLDIFLDAFRHLLLPALT